MGKQAEREADEKRRQHAANLFARFRGNATPGLNFAGFLAQSLDAGFISGGQLKKEHKIDHEAINKAKKGKQTDVPGEVRERFLRAFCQVNGISYYARASVTKMAAANRDHRNEGIRPQV